MRKVLILLQTCLGYSWLLTILCEFQISSLNSVNKSVRILLKWQCIQRLIWREKAHYGYLSLPSRNKLYLPIYLVFLQRISVQFIFFFHISLIFFSYVYSPLTYSFVALVNDTFNFSFLFIKVMRFLKVVHSCTSLHPKILFLKGHHF